MAFNALKAALHMLKPAGLRGFEGLTQAALSSVTGLPFLLAGSGEQGGLDGEANHISFECKLYTTILSPNDVKAKVASLTPRNDVDLWVLVTTVHMKAQLARALRDQGAVAGLEVQVIDWSEVLGAPRLAVLIAQMDPDTLDRFFRDCGVPDRVAEQVRQELGAFRVSALFQPATETLAQQLDVPNLGFEAARASNDRWLRDILADTERARHGLGQPIAPLATAVPMNRVFRNSLTVPLIDHMTSTDPRPVLMILGEEGVGKSWAALDAWLRIDRPPLLLFVPAGQLAAGGAPGDIIGVLERFLPGQLDHHGLPDDPVRWHRTITRWLQRRRNLSLVLVVDGINQHANADWGALIGRLAHGLKASGGQIIVSSRTGFFDLQVAGRLAASVNRIVVPEWTTDERDTVLAAAGRAASHLSDKVGTSLRNPRLLSVCLTLLDDHTLHELNEVSIPHLIFRHLESIERDSPTPVDVRSMRDRLKRHAQNLSDAMSAEQKDALATIDDLDAAKEGRFLRVIEDDTVRFELVNEGLTLAMGLLLFDRIHSRVRAGHEVTEEVARIIEPIVAADLTADIVLSAALIADGRRSDGGEEVMTALLIAFVRLQNVSSERLAGFRALCRKRPQAFLRAAERTWLEPRRPFEAAWLESAVMQLRNEKDGWAVATLEIQRWLRHFSRDHRPLPRMDGDAEYEERAAAARQEIVFRLESLTAAERLVVERLTDSPANISALSGLAFKLLAGQPLAPFVPALSDWCFGHQINPLPHASVYELDWLGQYNTVDWTATRDAVRTHLEALPDEALSTPGLKAKIRLLRFCGDADDGERALTLHRRLQPPRPHLRARVVPNPFDPEAVFDRPPHTGDGQAAIDVARLHASRHITSEDHLWRRALPEAVRTHPQWAVAKARALIAHVPTRTGEALQYGLFALDSVGLLLTHEDARGLVAFRRGGYFVASSGMGESERHLMSWYLLLLAFPHLSGDEQLDAMTDVAFDESIATQLLPAFKMPSSRHASAVIERVRGASARERRLVAGFLSECRMVLPPNTGALIDAFDQGDDAVYALLLVAREANPMRLAQFADSGWSATTADNDAVGFFGSMVLIEAMRQGITSAVDVAPRLCVEAWGEMARATEDGARAVAGLLGHFIDRLAGVGIVRPVIDIELQDRPDRWPRRLPDVTRPARSDVDVDGLYDEFGATAEEHQVRVEQDHQELLRIDAALARQGAQAVLRALFPEDMVAIERAAPNIVRQWIPRLMDIPPSKQSLACNTAMLVAAALANTEHGVALDLIRRFEGVEPFIRVVLGRARYPLLVDVIWGGKDERTWASLRMNRVTNAESDEALFVEALAAQRAGNMRALLLLIDECLASSLPSVQSRGLVLIGFLDECDDARVRLDAWRDQHGMAGAAWKVAKHSWKKNAWSRHWFAQMVTAISNEDAWRAQVLFLECVDARFELWSAELLRDAPGAWRFDGTVENDLRNRFGRQRSDRSARLFASPRPRDEFLFPHGRPLASDG
ncbi:MAG: hypothetical protein WBW32_04025 [Luteibacter sp.]